MPKRIIHIVLDVLALLLLLGTIVFLIVSWTHIPDTVPTHFNAKGGIDGWGGKASLLMLPAVGVVLYVVLSLSKTLRFRSPGKEVRFSAPELMFPSLKLALSAGFAYMTVCGAKARPLGMWYMPVFLALIFLPIVVFAVLMLRRR